MSSAKQQASANFLALKNYMWPAPAITVEDHVSPWLTYHP
jgi:hypothetical protein